MGGLGNQLFQLFNLLSYAETNRQEFFLEDLPPQREDRPFYWNTFLAPLRKYLKPSIPLPVYQETKFEYDPIQSYRQINQPFKFLGYFQSYKYFQKNENILFEHIQLKETLDKTRENYPFDYSDFISMHFRVGDYKYLPEHHPVLSLSYYTSALNVMMRMTSARRVLYFYEPDDKDHVDEYIRLLKPLFPDMDFISIDHTIPDYEQLCLMACCSHQIIANSTFSWWGGYFNTNPDKIVTYPSKWFGPAQQKDTTDLFPTTWIKI
jgi:hypothetical protein